MIETCTEREAITFLGSGNSKLENTINGQTNFDDTLNNVIESKNETPELSELRKAINKQKCKYDLNGDGRVTKEEIEEALGKKKVQDDVDENSENESKSINDESTTTVDEVSETTEDTRKTMVLKEDDIDITKIVPMQSDKVMAIFKNFMEKSYIK